MLRGLLLTVLAACGGPAASDDDLPAESDPPAVDPDSDAPHSDPPADSPVDSEVVADGVTQVEHLDVVDADGDGTPARFDCDDGDGTRGPGMREVCNGRDDDCDQLVDDADPGVDHASSPSAFRRYLDADADGVGAAPAVWTCDDPGAGWSAVGGDCDDADADAFPGAGPRDGASACLRDVDGDGWGDASAVAPVAAGTDCDDADAAVAPDALEVPYDGVDQDCRDGDACDLDGDGARSTVPACGGDDCDDGTAAAHPGAAELCDGFDDDCDGLVDEDDPDLDPAALRFAWFDADHDGWGDPDVTGWACDVLGGDWVANGEDCDDAAAGVNPGATEIPWDGVDQDCSGADRCDVDGDGVLARGPCGGDDCDDLDSGTRPGALEACDDVDRDCDGLADPLDPDVDPTQVAVYWRDGDGDGWGGAAASETACVAVRPGWSLRSGDCDDADATVYPDRTEVPYNGKDDDCVGGDACDGDGDGVAAAACGGADCDDADARRAPGRPEVCDGFDDDCDALVDDADPDVDPAGLTAVWRDGDGDGWGDPAVPRGTCVASAPGWSVRAGDCDDTTAAVSPAHAEVPYDGVDQDCDGAELCDVDGDGAAAAAGVCGGADCDDRDARRAPGKVEACDGFDDDCDGLVDDADPDRDPASATRLWRDRDGDGAGDPAVTELGCEVFRPGWVRVDGDCDDGNAAIRPGALEICSGVDEDCDGLVDDADPGVLVADPWHLDVDGDGFPRFEDPVVTCARPPGALHLVGAFDCDDTVATTFPGAAEAESTVACSADADGDGWGATHPPEGVISGADCDDAAAATFPGAAERESASSCRADVDGDGFGSTTPAFGVAPGGDCADDVATTFPGAAEFESSTSCRADADADGYGAQAPAAGTEAGADCDDATATTFPGADDAWYDGVDADCDLRDDFDQDGDGHRVAATGGDDCDDTRAAVYPGAAEVPYNGLDDDCAGGDACDLDGDGALAAAPACGGLDCDDRDDRRSPALVEVCDRIDDDCDGLVDEADPGIDRALLVTLWADADGDAFGDPDAPIASCDPVRPGFVAEATDCAPTVATAHPGAPEICSGIDDDCDGLVDQLDPDVVDVPVWSDDGDGDGVPVAGIFRQQCDAPGPGWGVWTGLPDCDDQDPLTFPGAAEEESATACMTDADGDGWGGFAVVPEATPGTDCDDLDPLRAPGFAEVWYDDVDEHCDAGDDWDADGDGFRAPPLGDDCDDVHVDAHPGGVEIVGDGIDQDCSGEDLCPLGLHPLCARPSCADLLAEGAVADGTYWIAPPGKAPFTVICDQTHDGGGWTLVAVVSDDGQSSWTLFSTNWANGYGVFGDLAAPHRDLRSAAFRSVPVHDLLFVHAPSSTWAAYDDVGDGTRDLGALLTGVGATCYATVSGYPMTAGNLTAGGGGSYLLCSTALYLNPRDQAGSAGGCITSSSGNAVGPAWSTSANTSGSFCPMYKPGQRAGLGPTYVDVSVEEDDLGWGRAKGLNVGGALSDGSRHMSVYVR